MARVRRGPAILTWTPEHGKDLAELDPRIYLTNLESQVSTETAFSSPCRMPGQRIMHQRRLSLETVLTIFLKEPRIQEREMLLSTLLHSLKPGMYTSNARPSQVLQVDQILCPQTPPILSWTQTITIRCLSCCVPYWQGHVQEISGDMRSGELQITPGGHTDVLPLELEVTNLDTRDMDRLEVETGSDVRLSWMSFSGLQLRPGASFRLWYDKQHIQRICSGDKLALSCRSAASSDELLVRCGAENVLGVDASARVHVQARYRELYL